MVHVDSLRFESSSNAEFTEQLLKWNFKESGVLRVANVSHHKVGESYARHEYTITDEIVYKIDIEEKDENGIWRAYKASDVQLELVRIDPFIRRNLKFKGL